MKKLIFISGVLSANLMLFGSFFKIYHWPFANILLTTAVLLFCFLFLPAALLFSYRSETKNKFKAIHLTTFVVFFLGVMAMLFKIEHWPYNKEILFIALPLPFILFLPVYFYETRKEDKNNLNMLAVMTGLTFLAVFSVLLSVH